VIRDAREDDLAAIVAIYNAAIPGRQATADTQPVSVESRASWFHDRAPERHPIWVWEEAGGEAAEKSDEAAEKSDEAAEKSDEAAAKSPSVAGWLSFGKFYGRPAYAATAEVSIYVDPAAQRRGIARALLHEAIARAPALGLTTLLGFIFAHNTASVALCLGFGFQRWGLMPRVAQLDGVERDLLILGLRVGG
jgi:phosphinothricin acetyltransferase